MENAILSMEVLSDSTITDIVSRDAALWIGPGLENSEAFHGVLAQVFALPWKFIFMESTDVDFLDKALSVEANDPRLTALRGHIHVVASDPRDQTFAPRSLPIFLLNGRSDVSSGPESASLPGMSAVRRRLNMLSYLEHLPPKRLCILDVEDGEFLSEVTQLWEEGYRSLLSVISERSEAKDTLAQWLDEASFQLAIELPRSPSIDVLSDLCKRVDSLVPDGRNKCRVSRTSGSRRL